MGIFKLSHIALIYIFFIYDWIQRESLEPPWTVQSNPDLSCVNAFLQSTFNRSKGTAASEDKRAYNGLKESLQTFTKQQLWSQADDQISQKIVQWQWRVQDFVKEHCAPSSLPLFLAALPFLTLPPLYTTFSCPGSEVRAPVVGSPAVLPPDFFWNITCDFVHCAAFWWRVCGSPDSTFVNIFMSAPRGRSMLPLAYVTVQRDPLSGWTALFPHTRCRSWRWLSWHAMRCTRWEKDWYDSEAVATESTASRHHDAQIWRVAWPFTSHYT